ncbi:GMC family oxidoreductase [Leptolyngbya sp. FACHB-16]|nr:GMC family oxidoreductase [Leptolyngbya sp. FACHB-8]MBD2155753.1 GMC family oxidoreductase [Leptolyngbya sp. FACHB-16]
MNPMSSPEYDAIVVGAGATGGVAAKELSERGLTVLVLDAGPQRTPDVAVPNIVRDSVLRAQNLATRQQSYQALHPGYWKANPTLFVNEKENPYTTPGDRPFSWIRGRQVGGRSLTWGGITLRLSDYEFKSASQDGFGEDWPLSHDELAPYYERLERFFEVKGARDSLPQLPDGPYAAPASLTPAELYFKDVVEQGGDRALIVSRGFGLHRPTPENIWPRSSSLGSSLKAALQTGKVTIQPDAVVSHVVFDPNTRQARGVGYIHRTLHTAHEVQARLVVLCASTLESVRILLHSTEQYQTGGLANESGLLGRYVTDHISTMRFFTLPEFQQPAHAFDLSGCDSFFVPRFSNLGSQQESFLRGYGLWGGIQRVAIPGLVSRVGNQAIGFLVGHGEVLPQYDNRVRLDGRMVDAWGIPVPHIDVSWTDNEHRMRVHMLEQIETLVDKAGGQCLELPELFRAPLMGAPLRWIEDKSMTGTPPGFYVHELGGARMGTSPQNSVLNPYNQCWESSNLLVVDGACWPSAGWQNPTLTEMAITARACEYAVRNSKA